MAFQIRPAMMLQMLACITLSSQLLSQAVGTDVYVSPLGSDTSGDGSQAKPFATLTKTQQAARKVLMQPLTSNLVIHVGVGAYYQREPLKFTSADSGRNGFRVQWTGPGVFGTNPYDAKSTAVIHGGIEVPSHAWERVGTSEIWAVNVSSLAPSPPPNTTLSTSPSDVNHQPAPTNNFPSRYNLEEHVSDGPGPPVANQTYTACGTVLVDMSYNGFDMGHFWTGGINQCCAKCANTTGCKAWSYCNLPDDGSVCGSKAEPVDCYLKTGIPTPVFFNQRVSGIPGKGCRPQYPPTPPTPPPTPPPPPPNTNWKFFNLIEDRVGAVLARQPKKGSGYLKDVGCKNSDTSISCLPGVLPTDLVPDDLSVYVNIGADWFTETRKVTAVSAGGAAISFEKGKYGGANNKVYVQGGKSFITEPGEWALDSRAQMLYLWPRNAMAMQAGTANVVITTTSRVLDVVGLGWEDGERAEAIDFIGLVLSGSDFSSDYLLFTRSNDTPVAEREGMVRMENASDITVSDSAMLDAGFSAVFLQGFAQNISITGNWIERPGFCGVFLNGIYPGDTTSASIGVIPGGAINSAAASDVNTGHLISNNYIHDYGQRVGHGSGVWFFQSGHVRVTQNFVQEGPRDAFGVYGIRFGNGGGSGSGVLPLVVYNKTLDFWGALDVLHTRYIEIDNNVVENCVRDTADAGALEYWGVGAFNTAHHNCFSDMDPGVLDGSWMNFLFQDDASHYLNFSSNIVFEMKGAGSEEGGMIKSVGSIFENSVIADSTLGHLFNIEPYVEPAANIVFQTNIFSNINSTSGNLDFSFNINTESTLAHSASLAPFSNYGFAKGAPPGWPSLSLTDKVVKTWDHNTYWGLQGYDNGSAVSKQGWDTNAGYTDPQLTPSSTSKPWNRVCADFVPASGSPVFKQGFRQIDTSNIGLSSLFKWDRSTMGAVSGGDKIQTERYNRMHGLWRAGSLGISSEGSATQFPFKSDAWARYDNVNVDCVAPCNVVLKYKSSTPRQIAFAVGEPSLNAVVANTTAPPVVLWTTISIAVPKGLMVTAASIFLLIDGRCDIDYFWFNSTK
eukprot:m.207986 g.207986  ORF g.207986 m.207986 type:complete len:1066 (+) comp32998_c0_seq1:2-3199(+)